MMNNILGISITMAQQPYPIVMKMTLLLGMCLKKNSLSILKNLQL